MTGSCNVYLEIFKALSDDTWLAIIEKLTLQDLDCKRWEMDTLFHK